MASCEVATAPVETEAEELTTRIAVKEGNPNAKMEFERYVFEMENFLPAHTKKV